MAPHRNTTLQTNHYNGRLPTQKRCTNCSYLVRFPSATGVPELCRKTANETPSLVTPFPPPFYIHFRPRRSAIRGAMNCRQRCTSAADTGMNQLQPHSQPRHVTSQQGRRPLPSSRIEQEQENDAAKVQRDPNTD